MSQVFTAHNRRPDGGCAKCVPMKLLSVSAAEEDHSAVRLCLADIPCEMVTAPTCSRALHVLERGDTPIIVCESNLPDGTWRDILNGLRSTSDKPIMIVTSHHADDCLWAEVLNLGGFDVIAKPFHIRNCVTSSKPLVYAALPDLHGLPVA